LKPVDAFAGSGSYGVACSKLNRVYYGSEIEREYAALATSRLVTPQKKTA
jgi:DNA modification methylase